VLRPLKGCLDPCVLMSWVLVSAAQDSYASATDLFLCWWKDLGHSLQYPDMVTTSVLCSKVLHFASTPESRCAVCEKVAVHSYKSSEVVLSDTISRFMLIPTVGS
jgi:hypothetical protein